jgi:hypothetical protein
MWKRKNNNQDIISVPTAFPNGFALSDDKNKYFIKNGKRYKLFSDRAAQSWGFKYVLVTQNAYKNIPLGGTLGFRDGTVIKDISDGKIYLIENSKKRHITSPDFFEKYGFDRNWIIEVSKKETSLHKDGEDID